VGTGIQNWLPFAVVFMRLSANLRRVSLLCDVLCDITRPSLGGVESNNSYWVGVIATADLMRNQVGQSHRAPQVMDEI
jgi:hypothetical protein